MRRHILGEESDLDPRVKRTRKFLQTALLDLLREKPLQTITVRDIAERATVNRATFYAHFVDKFDLFSYLIREMFQAALIAHMPDDTTFCVSHLRTLILATHDFMQQFQSGCTPADHEFKPLIEAQVQTELYNFLLKWFEAQPDLQLPASPENTAVLMSWAIFGAALQWQHGTSGQHTDQEHQLMAEQVIAFLTGGLVGKGDVAHVVVAHHSN